MKVVVYSHDADTRAEIKLAIGARPAPDAPEAEIVEVATAPALFRLLDAGGIGVMVLDGEAQPAGGMGVSRQAKTRSIIAPLRCWSSAGLTTAGSRPGPGRKR
jgi:hypothetical protein